MDSPLSIILIFFSFHAFIFDCWPFFSFTMPLIADWLDESKCKRGVTMGMKEKRKGSRRHPGVAEDFLRSKRKIQRRSKVVVSKVKSADFRQCFHREGRDLCTSLNRIITFFSLNDRKSTAAVWRLFIPVFYGVYTSLKNPFYSFRVDCSSQASRFCSPSSRNCQQRHGQHQFIADSPSCRTVVSAF